MAVSILDAGSPSWVYEQFQLFVAMPCVVSDGALDALLDTASQWCVLPTWVASGLGYDLEPASPEAFLSTRFGELRGRLERIPVRFAAEEGEPIEVDATWFLSEDWIGPPVIGWKGCLERIRFALDPGEVQFYFAEL
jgi:hypothetical protein